MRIIFFSVLISFLAFAQLGIAQTNPPLTVVLNQNSDIGYVRLLFSDLGVDLNKNGQLINTRNMVNNQSLLFDYYDQFASSEKRGKLKSAGTVDIDYYDRFDGDAKKGKIKSIGNIEIDYYDQFDGPLQGKIKSIGNQVIAYYDQFSGDEKKGKLKAVGPVRIEYYDRFDGKYRTGKIKSIIGNEQGTIRVLIN